MQRVAVIGNAGGGKSALARRLADTHGLPYHEIDALQWRPDWSAVPAREFDAAHEAILGRDAWVLDGFGSWASIEGRFRRAEAIILIDLPLWVHFWWAAERQIAWTKGATDAVPAGHPEPPPTEELFKMIWEIDRHSMPRLREMVAAAEGGGTAVIRLDAIEAIDAFKARDLPPG